MAMAINANISTIYVNFRMSEHSENMNVASDNVNDIVEAQAGVEVSEHQRYNIMTTNAFGPLCSQISCYNSLLHCRCMLQIIFCHA